MAYPYLALGAPRPSTATEVGDFLSKNIYPLTSIHAKGDKNYLQRMIDKLQTMRDESMRSEERAYNMLGVRDLDDLQLKLDEINKQGLFSLSNRALRQMPAIKQTRNSGIHIKDVRDAIEKEFEIYLQGKGYKNITAAGYELGSREVQKLFSDFEKNKLGVQKGTIFASFRYSSKLTKKQSNSKSGEKILGLFFKEIKKDRKNKLVSALQLKTLNSGATDDELAEMELVIDGADEKYYLNYYPYFSLTEEEKKEAREDTELWERFVEAVSKCAGGLKENVRYVMTNIMEPEDFISTGGSYADVIGIMGELQTLTFLYTLGASKDLLPRFLGHATNMKSQKVGVDVALQNIGFQVKNYKMYGNREDGNEGIMLSGDYTLKNFLDLIEPNFDTPGMRYNLEHFYALSAYHMAVHSDFNNIRTWMDNMQQKYLPRLYHGAVAELLPLKQITWIDKDKDMNFMGKTTNAFYLIGGERILPVSKILSLYIKYLIDFKQNIDNPKLITMRGDNVGVKYTGGTTYADYWNDDGSYVFPGYSKIADNIYIRYNINMNIDYSIEEVLSKSLKI